MIKSIEKLYDEIFKRLVLVFVSAVVCFFPTSSIGEIVPHWDKLEIRDSTCYLNGKPVIIVGVCAWVQNPDYFKIIKDCGFNGVELHLDYTPKGCFQSAIEYGLRITLNLSGHEGRNAIHKYIYDSYPRILPNAIWHGFMLGKKEGQLICLDEEEPRNALKERLKVEYDNKIKGIESYIHSICVWNEPGYNCYCPQSKEGFRQWLKDRYKNLDSLNKIWQTNFRNFEEIQPPPFKIIRDGDDRKFKYENYNPAHCTEWERFNIERTTQLLLWWKSVINELTKGNTPTHVKVTRASFRPTTGKYGISKQYIFDRVEEIYGYDGGYEASKSDGNLLGFSLMNLYMDIGRTMANGKLVFNSEYHRTGHSRESEQLSHEDFEGEDRKNLIRSQLLLPIMHGTGAYYIWRWWGNNIDYPRWTSEDMGVVKNVIEEIRRITPDITPLNYSAKIALVFSLDTLLLTREEEQISAASPPPCTHIKRMIDFHRAVTFSGMVCDVLTLKAIARGDNISKYRVIILPFVETTMPELEKNLEEWVKKGGILIITQGSLQKDIHGRSVSIPSFIGIKTIKMKNLRKREVKIKSDDPTLNGVEVSGALDFLKLDDAKPLAKYKDNVIASVKSIGKGKVLYLGMNLKDVQIQKFIWRYRERISPEFLFTDVQGNPQWGVEGWYINHKSKRRFYLMNYMLEKKVVQLKFGFKAEGFFETKNKKIIGFQDNMRLTIKPAELKIYIIN